MNQSDITIQIFPMKTELSGDARLCESHEEPDFFDILVRYDGQDPIEEVDNIPTFEEAYARAEQLHKKYPGSDIYEINL